MKEIKAFEAIEEIKWTDELEKEIYGDVDVYSSEGFYILMQWCEDTNTTYYGQVDERFSTMEGYQKAVDEGNVRLILDNMS